MQKITINGKEYLERTESWEIRTGTEFDICTGHDVLSNNCWNPLPVREKKLIHRLSAGFYPEALNEKSKPTVFPAHCFRPDNSYGFYFVYPRQVFTICPNCWVDYMRQVLKIEDEQLIWDIVSAEAEAWIGVNQYPKLQTYLESKIEGENDVAR
jgi:hypothetical protein